ncbi:MAG: hypothetical protein ACAI37_22350 [Chthoniobacter sp.]
MKDPIRETSQVPQAAFALNDIGIADRDLRVEMFTLCDGATEQEGRISLVGTYESISAASFPCVLPQLTVVLRARFWPQDGRLHAFRLVLTSPDGKSLGVLLDSMASMQSFNEDRSTSCNLIARVQNVEIEAAGEHVLDFYIDDKIAGRLPFSIYPMVRS